jgi:hypothetical protein
MHAATRGTSQTSYTWGQRKRRTGVWFEDLRPLGCVAFLLLGACSGTPDGTAGQVPTGPQERPAADALSLKLRVPAGAETPVTLDAEPGAACVLHGSASDAADGLPLAADASGQVRVHLRPNAETPSTLLLDCEVNGRAIATKTYVVEAGAADEAPSGAASPRPEAVLAERPALSGDPAQFTDAELVARGFPLRPDATKAPDAYAKWLELASKPARIVPMTTATMPRQHRAARPGVAEPGAQEDRVQENPYYGSTSPNWCGYAVTNPGAYYQYIVGAWAVPTVTPEPGSFFSPWYINYSSVWVGLDGYGTPDVVQAGTEQDTQTIAGITATNYYAWTENYPAYPLGAQVSVYPGDLVYTYVWVGLADGTATPFGSYGWYYIYNFSRGTVSYTSSPLAYPFAGSTAEWIVEKPAVSTISYGLANFHQVAMYGSYVYDFNWGQHSILTDPSWDIWLYNGSDLLCYPYTAGSGSGVPTFNYVFYNYN